MKFYDEMLSLAEKVHCENKISRVKRIYAEHKEIFKAIVSKKGFDAEHSFVVPIEYEYGIARLLHEDGFGDIGLYHYGLGLQTTPTHVKFTFKLDW